MYFGKLKIRMFVGKNKGFKLTTFVTAVKDTVDSINIRHQSLRP